MRNPKRKVAKSDGSRKWMQEIRRRPTFESGSLLSLGPEAEAGLFVGAAAAGVALIRAALEERGDEGRRGARECWSEVLRGGEDAPRLGAPSRDGAARARGVPEDEAEDDVEAADGEEEEGGDEREVVDVVREDGGAEEALEDADGAEAEGGAEDGEVVREEGGWPADLGEEEDDDLEDDEEAVDDGPEDAGWLVGHCATSVRINKHEKMCEEA